jgi:UDP-glucose 4-epimerase
MSPTPSTPRCVPASLDVPLLLNVGGGEEATMLQVISTIEDIAGKPLDIRAAGDGKGDVRRTAADTRTARHVGMGPEHHLGRGPHQSARMGGDRSS